MPAILSIKMPQLGESMAEATIRSILISEGDKIKLDQNVFEVETDKAIMEVTTPFSGVVEKINVSIGNKYSVGDTLCTVNPNDFKNEKETDNEISNIEDTDIKNEESSLHFKVEETNIINQSNHETNTQELSNHNNNFSVPIRSNVYLSPILRHKMDELGLNSSDISSIPGSGSGGRVTVNDFEKFIKEIEQSNITEASPMRIAVADSMRRSWTRPLATVTVPVLMNKLILWRKKLNKKPGITLYIMKALAIAIAENTAIAGRLIGNRIVHPRSIDIGFAVEVEDGVMVPVIRDMDKHKISDLHEEYNKFILLAKNRHLNSYHSKGGIATVTNVGPFGITSATPIPLPEQNLVLGVMAGKKVPFWNKETNAFIPQIESSFILSFDHRILDGGAAGKTLQRVGELLQKPQDL